MAAHDAESPSPIFPRLSGQAARAMGPERVAAHQRRRLLGAMVAAVDKRGYEGVTVGELVALAGVSKSAFYREFSGKEDCFLTAFDEIVDEGAAVIEAAWCSGEGIKGRLVAAAEAFIEVAVEQGAAGRLVFLASLELGAAAVATRERAIRRFEEMVSRSLAEVAGGRKPSPLAVRGVVGGAHEVVYRRLRDSELERLRGEVGGLVGWVLGFAPGESEAPSPGRRLLAELPGGSGRGVEKDEGVEVAGWEDPPAGRRARRALSQRERIMRATAQVVAHEGYGALSVAAISARAGVSNQTFYAEFESKEDAFLAAFDALALASFEQTAGAFSARDGWLRSGAAGILALLSHFARNPLHRRLFFVGLPAAGPAAMARAEAMLEVFIALLEPQELPTEVTVRPPRVVLEAIAGGIWAIVAREVLEGRGDSLPDLAPELIDFVLVAFGVAAP